MNTTAWLIRREFWGKPRDLGDSGGHRRDHAVGGLCSATSSIWHCPRSFRPLPSARSSWSPSSRQFFRRDVDLLHLVPAGLPVWPIARIAVCVVLEVIADLRHRDGHVQAGHGLARHSAGVILWPAIWTSLLMAFIVSVRASALVGGAFVACRPLAAAAGLLDLLDRHRRHLVPADCGVFAGDIRLGQACRDACGPYCRRSPRSSSSAGFFGTHVIAHQIGTRSRELAGGGVQCQAGILDHDRRRPGAPSARRPTFGAF